MPQSPVRTPRTHSSPPENGPADAGPVSYHFLMPGDDGHSEPMQRAAAVYERVLAPVRAAAAAALAEAAVQKDRGIAEALVDGIQTRLATCEQRRCLGESGGCRGYRQVNVYGLATISVCAGHGLLCQDARGPAAPDDGCMCLLAFGGCAFHEHEGGSVPCCASHAREAASVLLSDAEAILCRPNGDEQERWQIVNTLPYMWRVLFGVRCPDDGPGEEAGLLWHLGGPEREARDRQWRRAWPSVKAALENAAKRQAGAALVHRCGLERPQSLFRPLSGQPEKRWRQLHSGQAPPPGVQPFVELARLAAERRREQGIPCANRCQDDWKFTMDVWEAARVEQVSEYWSAEIARGLPRLSPAAPLPAVHHNPLLTEPARRCEELMRAPARRCKRARGQRRPESFDAIVAGFMARLPGACIGSK